MGEPSDEHPLPAGGPAGGAPALARTELGPPPSASGTAPGQTANAAASKTAIATGDTHIDTGDAARPATTVNLRARTVAPGTPSIPGYQLGEVLGEGGMGTVYAAEQDAPRRPVAIKVLHAASPSALARFRTEANIMARLDHPGIARVLEAGEAQGHPFLVMEHVDGATLDGYVAELPRARRLALFVALCEAVHHAHVKGVIHRDLKPSNVMVRPGDRVVVLDFGVARLAAADGSASGETRAGEMLGTPLYMSPEQARLRPNEVDARSDVYTLGVMLYELLCNELPYDVRGMPLPAIALTIVEDEPVALSKRDPSLRGDLDAITDKALRKLPTERYQSAAALGDDVRRVLEGLPVSVRVPGTVEQLRRFVRRRPLLAGGVAAALVGGAVFAIVVTRLWLEASEARTIAEDAQHTTEVARASLELRTNELTLRQARAALVRDPTEALGWLAGLVEAGPAHSSTFDAQAAWGVLDEAVGRGVASQVLRGHADEAHWVEPLAGGPDFVTGGYDGRVLLWQPPAFAPRELVHAKHGRVHLVRPSPDGAILAVGADEGELLLVGRDGRMLGALPGHVGDVQHMAWSRDGAWLVTGDDHGNAWLWPRTGAPGRRLVSGSSSTSAMGALAFAADGSAVVGGNHAGALWLWGVTSDAAMSANVGVDIVDVWTDGARVTAVDAAGTVRTWRVGEGLTLERTVATGLATKRAVFAPDGSWLVLGGLSGFATRVEGEATEVVARHRVQVRYLAISDDGTQIATASDDGMLQVIDRATGRHRTLRGHAARVRHIAFAGDVLLSSDGEGVVRRWRLGAMPASVLDGASAPAARLVSDEHELASIDAEGEVSLWTVIGRGAGGRRVAGRVSGHASAIAIVRPPDSPRGVVVTGTAEGEVAWWREGGAVQRRVGGIVRGIADRGDWVAVATSDGPIALFGVDGAERGALPGNTRGTEVLAFSLDGELLAAGGQDRVIRVYRRAAGAGVGFEEIAALPGPTGDTHFVAFTAAGDRLFSAGNDGAVFGWRVGGTSGKRTIDPATRTLIAKHTGAVSGLAIAPDDRSVVSSGRDNWIVRTPLDGRGLSSAGSAAAWQRGVVEGGAPIRVQLTGAATMIAFDVLGGLRVVTRTGAVLHVAPTGQVSSVIDHGALGGAAIGDGRLAVALEDGEIAIASAGPHTRDELARAVTAARAP